MYVVAGGELQSHPSGAIHIWGPLESGEALFPRLRQENALGSCLGAFNPCGVFLIYVWRPRRSLHPLQGYVLSVSGGRQHPLQFPSPFQGVLGWGPGEEPRPGIPTSPKEIFFGRFWRPSASADSWSSAAMIRSLREGAPCDHEMSKTSIQNLSVTPASSLCSGGQLDGEGCKTATFG
jgi:hypothetical protein